MSCYIEWLKAARWLYYLDEPPTPGAHITDFTERKRHLNDLTTELQVIASPAVGRAARAYLDKANGRDVTAALSGRYASRDDVIDAFSALMEAERVDVVRAMRLDLGSGSLTPAPETV